MTVEDKQAATRSGKGEEYYAALPRKALQALAKEKGIPATGGNDALRAALVKADEEAAAAKTAAPAPAAAAAAAAAAPASPSAGSKRKLDDVANGSDDAAAAAEDAEGEDGKASKVAKTDGATDAATSAAASGAPSPAPAAAAAAAPAAAPAVDLKGSRWLLMGGFDCGKGFIQSKLSRAGAEIAPGVSKKVNYVLVGKPVVNEYGAVSGPGSKKHKECKKMKLNCIDEASALQLLKDF
jgi:NAD-dependent DNA ligase